MAVKNKNETTSMPEVEEKAARPVTPVPAAEKPEVKASAEKSGVFVYIGPSLKNLIQSGTIYRGTYAEVLKKLKHATTQYPLIKDFVVPGETLAADRLEIKRAGSLFNRKHNDLAKMAR